MWFVLSPSWVRPSMCTPVIPAVSYLLLSLQDVQWAVGNSRGTRKLARTPHIKKKHIYILNGHNVSHHCTTSRKRVVQWWNSKSISCPLGFQVHHFQTLFCNYHKIKGISLFLLWWMILSIRITQRQFLLVQVLGMYFSECPHKNLLDNLWTLTLIFLVLNFG
jgi:hypothetical protein